MMNTLLPPTTYLQRMELLIGTSQELSHASSLAKITEIVRKTARKLCGAEGATFILREKNMCYYVDEDAIEPLWKGRKFPLEICVSGWSILHGATAVIEDIYEDPRVLHEAYRPTFVKSLLMVPIREQSPLGAIGNYWARHYKPGPEDVMLLRSLANLTAIALENTNLVENMRKAQTQLEEALQARDEFLSVASHELRTPLCSLKLQLQLLERDLRPTEEHHLSPAKFREGLERSSRQVGNIGRLVENLLDVSRLRLHRMELNLSNFCLTRAVKEALDELKIHLDAAKCQLHTEFEESIVGNWDETRIKQIVTNLISNACKYAPGSQVTILTRSNNEFATLTVHDNGPGISRENQERIFERFERERHSEHVPGLGLGLYITKKLVEAHHGRIHLESAPNAGSRFQVELPLAANA